MRLTAEGEAGRLAAEPASALSALVELAKADGAEPHEWLAKALASVGAASLEVHDHETPAYQAVVDAQAEIEALAEVVALPMMQAIRARLLQAVREADIEALRETIEG